MCDSDSGLSVSMHGSQFETSCQSVIFIRLTNSDYNLDRVQSFSPNTKIIDVKLSTLDSITQEIKDKWNFGLFLPPSKGKAGKFLQEDRTLKEYPFENSVGHLELKYKQRIYRVLKTNANKLRKLHVKQNLRQFMDCVKTGDVEKVNKWLNRGLDPNFQTKESGDTPLTVAVGLEKPKEMIMTLVSGGAHLDYRAADTMTPLHRAAAVGNQEAIRVLLDLGQSPNTRDQLNLTPLYYGVLNNASDACLDALLFEHATLGTSDEAGLQEIHQACRFGRVPHLELLIFYGADINSQTSKNLNTPLHICAFTGQESCARLLLFRGAEKTLVNRAGHTAYQQAVLSGYTAVADIINTFRSTDVVPLLDRPKLSNRRRSSSINHGTQNRCSSLGRLNDHTSENVRYGRSNEAPLSMRAEAKFSNGSPPIGRNGYGLESSDRTPRGSKYAGSNQVRGLSQSTYCLDRSACVNSESDNGYPNYAATMKARSGGQRRYGIDDPSLSEYPERTNGSNSLWMPEGTSDTASIFSTASSIRGGQQSMSSVNVLQMSISRDASILDLDPKNFPRMVVLQKGPRGFGFIVRGRRGVPGEFKPTLDMPALQYLEKIEPQSAAELAGLKPGDYILEVNGTNVSTMSHELVVQLIRNSGEILGLKVITVDTDRLAECSTLGSQSIRNTTKAYAVPDYRTVSSSDQLSRMDATSLRSSTTIGTVRLQPNTPLTTRTSTDVYATLSKRYPPTSMYHSTASHAQSPTSSTFESFPSTVQNGRKHLSELFTQPESSTYNTLSMQSTRNSKQQPTTSQGTPQCTNVSEYSESNASRSVPPPPPPPPPPPLISSLKRLVPSTTISNGTSPSGPHPTSHSVSKPSAVANPAKNLADLDDQLPLPPPPAEIDMEIGVSNPVASNPVSTPSVCRQTEKPKDVQSNLGTGTMSFTEHLRKALELRRQKLEMNTDDEDEDTDSKLDTKVPGGSTFYSISTEQQNNVSSNGLTKLERSITLSQTGESSFKVAAEKLHLMALSRNSTVATPTLPPPDKFKDSNPCSTINGRTFRTNGHVPVSSYCNGDIATVTNGVSSKSMEFAKKSPVVPSKVIPPPPPPVFLTKPPCTFKTNL